MIFVTGSATRPKTSDKSGPRAGTTVHYRLTQPVVDIGTQAEAHKVKVLGIKGNDEHLMKHGDHTPWSFGKLPGWIYAIDLEELEGFEAWLVAKCRSTYDTTWIDFFNINGHQYNNAGYKVDNSDDQHFHVSVAKGHEKTHVTLLDDFLKELDDMSADDVWSHSISSPALKVTRSAADWLKAGAAADAKVDRLTSTVLAAAAADETRDRATLAAITVLTDALRGTGSSNLDTVAIVAAIHAEAENTRKDTATRITGMFAKLALSLKDSS